MLLLTQKEEIEPSIRSQNSTLEERIGTSVTKTEDNKFKAKGQ